jgi:exonuclease III
VASLPTNDCKLAVGHCNIQGGLTGIAKCLEIQNLIHREKLDILCLNETNLKSDIDTDSLHLPDNFTFIRKDRCTDNGHGGCGILISKNLKYKIVQLNLLFPTNTI